MLKRAIEKNQGNDQLSRVVYISHSRYASKDGFYFYFYFFRETLGSGVAPGPYNLLVAHSNA